VAVAGGSPEKAPAQTGKVNEGWEGTQTHAQPWANVTVLEHLTTANTLRPAGRQEHTPRTSCSSRKCPRKEK